ncbi:MAG: ornithine carbamoyltransferase [Planctomycetota bacterium]|nr:MAG: ornithine carbamoyltransferase [Planctomycetota bacterium]
MRHLINVSDLTTDEILRIFAISEDLKAKFRAGVREPLLPGRVMALVFEKQSLRTRVSFQAAMTHLGGASMMLGDDAGFGKRESLADFARVLSEMVDVIVLRTKKHQTVNEVAAHAACSVINGLTDQSHPCQALADLFTLREQFGALQGCKLAWVGDANNVARSLAMSCALLGVEFAVACPAGYEFEEAFVARLQSKAPGSKFRSTRDPLEAVRGASAVYTDVWASMGQEAELERRRRDFADYQVNGRLMAAASPTARFMHCLPARRGEEVTDEVMDGPYSIVVEQAANRMHVQKGILAWLLGAQA